MSDGRCDAREPLHDSAACLPRRPLLIAWFARGDLAFIAFLAIFYLVGANAF